MADGDYDPSAQSTPATPWRDTKTAKGLASAGRSMSQSGQDMIDSSRQQAAANANRSTWPSYRKGGKVRKTGLAKVHRGELVVPKKKARKVQKLMKRKGGRGI